MPPHRRAFPTLPCKIEVITNSCGRSVLKVDFFRQFRDVGCVKTILAGSSPISYVMLHNVHKCVHNEINEIIFQVMFVPQRPLPSHPQMTSQLAPVSRLSDNHLPPNFALRKRKLHMSDVTFCHLGLFQHIGVVISVPMIQLRWEKDYRESLPYKARSPSVTIKETLALRHSTKYKKLLAIAYM